VISRSIVRSLTTAALFGVIFRAPAIWAQELNQDQVTRILQRLDALEQQNRELLSEIRSLREELAKGNSQAPPSAESAGTAASSAGAAVAESAPTEERVDVAEQQIRDLAQSRVESEHRDPIQLTGMLLFNGFRNGRYSGGAEDPTIAASDAGQETSGGTIRQTILGLKFAAPEKIAGMEVTGSAYMDFFGGTGTSLNQLMRLRVASINFAWKNTTFTVAQDKPIFAPREPDSLAQVGFSPLTGSGNLWLWSPQVRVEQRFHFAETAGLNAQLGVYQTAERGNVPSEYTTQATGSRPSLEGRFVFWKQASADSRFEIAPGFHVSDSRVAGFVIPSRIVSLDWRVPLSKKFDLTGTVFHGENLGVVGGLQQGIAENSLDILHAVRGTGGWTQLKYIATPRLSFDLYGGQEDDLNRDLAPGGISKNQTYAANAIYRVMSNVLASFEYAYLRSTYLGGGVRSNPHYDVAFAYLF
jgi:hypothetical protein